MAYFRKLPSGKWQATVRTTDGRKITRTDPLKTVVKKWATDTEAAIARGKWRDPRKTHMTVGQWFDTWLPVHRVEAETERANEGSWRLHLKNTFQDIELDDLTKVEVEAWVKERIDAGIGHAAIRRALNLLKAGIEAAVDNEYVDKNVARKVQPPAGVNGPPEWFEPHEVVAIVKEMRKRGWEAMAVMTSVMVWSGLRWGEAAALNIEDIDFDRNTVSITHTLTQGGKDKDYPKNDASVGEVPCPSWVIAEIRELVGERTTGRLFTTRRQARNLSGGNWRRDWDDVLLAAKVSPYHPHVCRHTCASWLVQAGVPLYEVKRQLRHASIQTTERYAHLSPELHDPVRGAWEGLAHQWRTAGHQIPENNP
ncbi:tyrosine-type recombinase/integrase [Populibacterium corticicola]|uniref:Tyrosine-type recombinase/integrase n=1 Tax=Populibacterium corticicola TaxID=1812826 RepID=A0ABW5XDT6_9MICO